jgi:hypothetical protein
VSEPDAKAGGFWTQWSRLTTGAAALITALTGLITGLAAVGVIGGDGASAQQGSVAAVTDTAGGTTTGSSESFDPTAAERRLLALIPGEVKPRCKRADAHIAANSVADLVCLKPPGLAAGHVAYALFKTSDGPKAYIADRKTLGNADKDCGTGPAGSSSYGVNDKDVGWLICYLDKNDTAWIEWTNEPARVYAYAHRADSDWKALFSFWQDKAGPVAP